MVRFTTMRLLYLGSTDLPQPKARAIQIVHTCHALARAGADVTLVVGRRGRAPDRALAAYGLAPHPRLRVIAVPIARIPPTAPPRLLRLFTRLWQISYLAGLLAIAPRELAARRPDVVYARDLRTARLAAWFSHAAGARLGFEVHGLPSVEVRLGAGRAGLPPSAASRLRRLEQEVFDRSDCIVTITECARQIVLDDYGVPAERVRTIADAAPTPAATPNPSSLGAAEPAVYYVGQLYPWKGAGLVVEAAARVKRARFVIVGGLPNGRSGRGDPHLAELAARARDVGAADRIDFRGYVPYSRVGEELARATVAVLPLPDEPVARCFTSPLKLFDYMAAGVPVVASDLPSLREVLRHGENALLVRPGDAAALAAAIECLLTDPTLARRLATQARRDVMDYTWDARATRLLELLDG